MDRLKCKIHKIDALNIIINVTVQHLPLEVLHPFVIVTTDPVGRWLRRINTYHDNSPFFLCKKRVNDLRSTQCAAGKGLV